VLLLLVVIALFGLAGTAEAHTYCVQDAGCPVGGTGVSTVQDGLDLAQGNSGADQVRIGPNVCPACKFLGGSYSSADPLEIVGAGRQSTTLGASGVVALSLGDNPNVTVSDLTIALGTPASGLVLDGARATRVDVVAQAGADGSRAVVLRNGGAFRLGHVVVDAIGVGIVATDGAASIDSSLVKLGGASSTGLLADTPLARNVTLDARHVTVVGTGSSGQYGADVEAASAGETASLDLRNAIIASVGHSIRRNAAAGATAQVAADYSDYDGATVVASGSGGIAATMTTGVDPGFVDAGGGDFRLAASSPLVDAGEPGALTSADFLEDLAGNARLLDGDGDCTPRRDMGAYELLPDAVAVSASRSPAIALAGQPVAFDATASCDPDPAASLSFSWTFDDGATATGALVQHAFGSPGVHTAALSVTSSAGRTGSASLDVPIVLPSPSPPRSASLPAAVSPRESLVLIAARTVVVTRRGTVAIKLRCAGSRRCAGRIELTTTRSPRKAGNAAAAPRNLRLARAAFTIPAGRTAIVRLRISKAGLRLLGKARRLRAKVTVIDRDKAGRRRTASRLVALRKRR
jgi:hypothetical protein